MANFSRDLYQSLILDHNRSPLHFGKPSYFTAEKQGINPSCGDELTLYTDMKDGMIHDIGFVGQGCAIFKASCSLIFDHVMGLSIKEAQEFLSLFFALLLKKEDLDPQDLKTLGKLAIFEGVKQYPARVKCALLGARTLQALLQDENSSSVVVSTETHTE